MAQGGGLEELLLPTLDVDDVAVVWSAAVDAYLHNPALVPPNVERGRTVCAECGCEEFDQPFGGGPFTTPALNNMPWVAPGRPETAAFLGVRVKPGTEMALRNSVTSDGSDAWTSGLVGCGKATLTGVFQVVGLTSEAVRFGYAWFQTMLRGCDAPCDSSTLTVWLWCDQAASKGRRFLREARVVEFSIDDQDPNIHACQAIDVNVTWEIEDPRLFLAPVTLVDTHTSAWNIDMASTLCDTCQPSALCTPAQQGLVGIVISQVRELRPVELRGDRTWCPVGGYPLSDLQLFGGVNVAYPEAFTPYDPNRVKCDPCALYGIRLIWRMDIPATSNQLEFQTVRWVNGLWQSQSLAGIPCSCPIEVVELVKVHLVPSTTTPPGPPTVQRDVTSYNAKPTAGTECCVIRLNWLSGVHGNWASEPPPWLGSAQRVGFNPNPYVEGQIAPEISGWPPASCVITIRRDDCVEKSSDLGSCSDTDGPVRMYGNGSWAPIGWEHRITDPWPPPGRNIRVADQVTGSYPVLVYEPAQDADCVPGGAAYAHAIPPLSDPLLGSVASIDWCAPSSVCAYPVTIPAFGSEKLGTVIVTVTAGSGQIQWMRWAIWQRVPAWGDFNTTASRANYKAADPVAVGEIPILAPGQQVIFDGQQGQILLNCAQGVIESEQAGFGPYGMFTHPVLPGGVDYIFAMLPHPWTTPSDAWYKVQLVEWELP